MNTRCMQSPVNLPSLASGPVKYVESFTVAMVALVKRWCVPVAMVAVAMVTKAMVA